MSSPTCSTCGSPLPTEAAYCALCGSATHTQVIGETASHNGESATYQTQPGRLQRVLGDHFVLGDLLGRGGYAEVYAVRDRKLNRDIAIKVLRPDLIVTPSLLARFRREALAVAALQHPGIVAVYDVRESEGICYIVMPLIRGESLKALLQRQRRLPTAEVQRIVREAATALAAAHDAGLVHRDIKPENIMLEGKDASVRLMDFGIAKAVDSSEKDLTGTGVVVGTPQYMSPEQATGEPQIDHRSDQYSLAVVAYQMLSGRAPFEGETARAIIAKQLLDQPPELGSMVDNLPGHIVAALHRAMQKSPGKRFDSIQSFAAAMQDPTYVNPKSLDEPKPARVGSGSSGAWPWVGGAVLVVGLVGVVLSQWRQVPPVSSALPPADPPPPPTVAVAAPALLPTPTPTAPPLTVVPTRPFPADTPGSKVAPTPVDSVVSPAPIVPPASCATLEERQEWEGALDRCLDEARAGNVRAAKAAAAILANGRGNVTIDLAKAAEWYRQAAIGGDAESQFWVARRTETTDPTTSTEMYLAAARNNFGPAFSPLAARLEAGLGTARDTIAAAHWYERAALSGDVGNMLRMANLYTQGKWVRRSDSTARRWYERAATTSNHEAEFQLAQMYFKGRGVEKSEAEGLKWLQLAADGGHAEAKKELAKRKG